MFRPCCGVPSFGRTESALLGHFRQTVFGGGMFGASLVFCISLTNTSTTVFGHNLSKAHVLQNTVIKSYSEQKGCDLYRELSVLLDP